MTGFAKHPEATAKAGLLVASAPRNDDLRKDRSPDVAALIGLRRYSVSAAWSRPLFDLRLAAGNIGQELEAREPLHDFDRGPEVSGSRAAANAYVSAQHRPPPIRGQRTRSTN